MIPYKLQPFFIQSLPHEITGADSSVIAVSQPLVCLIHSISYRLQAGRVFCQPLSRYVLD